MSQQLHELIHRSSHIAFYSGVNAERQRIIKIIKDFGSEDFTADLISLINEDENGTD